MVVRDPVVEEVSGVVGCVHSWRLLCGGVRFAMASALRWHSFRDGVRLAMVLVS